MFVGESGRVGVGFVFVLCLKGKEMEGEGVPFQKVKL